MEDFWLQISNDLRLNLNFDILSAIETQHNHHRNHLANFNVHSFKIFLHDDAFASPL